MSTALRRLPLSELVRRAIERTGQNSWLALVVPDDQAKEIVEQIVSGISAESTTQVARADSPENADSLVRETHRPGILVVPLFDEWPDGEWARLDALRSRLQREHSVVLVLSESAARHLFREAPQFASFFTGSAWEIECDAEELTEPERVARIKSLESWAKMTTDEMIERAQMKDLPSEPEFAEWLVLVHRSDLL